MAGAFEADQQLAGAPGHERRRTALDVGVLARREHVGPGQDVASPGIPGALMGGLLSAACVDSKVLEKIRV